MKYQSFSLHQITKPNEFPFTPEDYSRFKYGSKSVARRFGTELADKFLAQLNFIIQMKSNFGLDANTENYLTALSTKQIIVVPSPYDFIPTATFAMKDYFIARLNEGLEELGIESVQETKVSRARSYNQDYGLMTAEERKEAISGDSFHIDREFVKGKFIIFLDDIYITGGHENRMAEMVEHYNIGEEDYMYMYFAQVLNKDVPANTEHYLNHAAAKDLWDIASIIRDDEFIFNTRVVKFILSAPEHEFCVFLAHQTDSFRHTLYHYMLGNKYHQLPEFNTNYLHLKHQDWMSVIKRVKETV